MDMGVGSNARPFKIILGVFLTQFFGKICPLCFIQYDAIITYTIKATFISE